MRDFLCPFPAPAAQRLKSKTLFFLQYLLQRRKGATIAAFIALRRYIATPNKNLRMDNGLNLVIRLHNTG